MDENDDINNTLGVKEGGGGGGGADMNAMMGFSAFGKDKKRHPNKKQKQHHQQQQQQQQNWGTKANTEPLGQRGARTYSETANSNIPTRNTMTTMMPTLPPGV